MLEHLLTQPWIRKALLLGATLTSLNGCTNTIVKTEYIEKPVPIDAASSIIEVDNDIGSTTDITPTDTMLPETMPETMLPDTTADAGGEYIDQNCPASQLRTFYQDKDDDGFGVKEQNVFACKKPHGYVPFVGKFDCDDYNFLINPGMIEICDGNDNNCNGETDEGLTLTRPCGVSTVGTCSIGTENRYCLEGKMTDWKDCTAVFPTLERCDGIDNNCDGVTDEGYDVGKLCATNVGDCGLDVFKLCTIDGLGTICDSASAEACCSTTGNEKDVVPCSPYSIFLLLDNSGSMMFNLESAKSVINDFVKNVSAAPGTSFGLITLRDDLTTYGFAPNAETMENWISTVSTDETDSGGDGPEGQLNAVVAAINQPWPEGSAKYVILFTDSVFHKEDAISPYSIPQVRDLLVENQIQIIGVDYGIINYAMGDPDLEELTQGIGELYTPAKAADLATIFAQLFEKTNSSWDECSPDKVWVTKEGNCPSK